MRSVLAVRQRFIRLKPNPDRLRLVRRKGNTPWCISNNIQSRLFLISRLLSIDIIKPSLRVHTAQFERDPVGRLFIADIVQDDLSSTTAVEDHARRCNEQITGGMCSC